MSQLEIIKKVKEECHNEYGNKYHYQGKCKGKTAILWHDNSMFKLHHIMSL